MSNFILGSGVIGCLAKAIFPDYSLVPFKRSRYYSFEIPYADNFIKHDVDIDEFMSSISQVRPAAYKIGISYKGKLFFDDIKEIRHMYLEKVYGSYKECWLDLMPSSFFVYKTDILLLHRTLQDKFINSINDSIGSDGELIKIDVNSHELIFRNKTVQYDKIISTIPLNALCDLCGISHDLKHKSVCYYYIVAKSVDLEGADMALVADKDIDFFKVVKLNDGYLFWTFDNISQPYHYFGNFLGFGIDILDAKRIDNVIPTGEGVDVEKHGIYPIGSNAQHDDFMDISSCIRRLLRYRNKSITS